MLIFLSRTFVLCVKKKERKKKEDIFQFLIIVSINLNNISIFNMLINRYYYSKRRLIHRSTCEFFIMAKISREMCHYVIG